MVEVRCAQDVAWQLPLEHWNEGLPRSANFRGRRLYLLELPLLPSLVIE
jgi:hypothetical protein